jgi:hypothetical protein
VPNIFFLDTPERRLQDLAGRTSAMYMVDPAQLAERSGRPLPDVDDWLDSIQRTVAPHGKADTADGFIVFWHANPDPKGGTAPLCIRQLESLRSTGRLPHWWRGVVFYRGFQLRPGPNTEALRQCGAFPNGVAVVKPELGNEEARDPAIRSLLEAFVQNAQANPNAQACDPLSANNPPAHLLAVSLVLAAHRSGTGNFSRLLTPDLTEQAANQYRFWSLRWRGDEWVWPYRPLEETDFPAMRAAVRGLLSRMVADPECWSRHLSRFGCQAYRNWKMWKHDLLQSHLSFNETTIRLNLRRGWGWLHDLATTLPGDLRAAVRSFRSDFRPGGLIEQLPPLASLGTTDRHALSTALDHLYASDPWPDQYVTQLRPAVEEFCEALVRFDELCWTVSGEQGAPQVWAAYQPFAGIRSRLVEVLNNLPSGLIP